MPRFEPFAGVRYDPARVDLDAVTAPPYDVISPEQRAVLADRSPCNAVHIDLVDQVPDGYDQARCHLDQWLADGILRTDPDVAFYVYRMGYTDARGASRQTVGVVGALVLSVPGEGDVLPHERTLAKAKDDRLRLMRACRANLSPVWCLSMAEGLTELCAVEGPPAARCTDDDGVHHRMWRVTRPAVVEAISRVVASAPVVIADGHHRYETALAYREERRAAGSGDAGEAERLMTFVVQLADGEAGVGPIHRLLHGSVDLSELISAVEKVVPMEPVHPSVGLDDQAAREGLGGPVLVTADGSWVLGGGGAVSDQPDSVRLEPVLAALPNLSVSFEPGADCVLAAVAENRCAAGVLLRPVSVEQIAAAAGAGVRLPEKTTFFYPKPRTGMVFRRC